MAIPRVISINKELLQLRILLFSRKLSYSNHLKGSVSSINFKIYVCIDRPPMISNQGTPNIRTNHNVTLAGMICEDYDNIIRKICTSQNSFPRLKTHPICADTQQQNRCIYSLPENKTRKDQFHLRHLWTLDRLVAPTRS